MKESNKSNIITGIVLLALASMFSVSLLLLPLDFGLAGPSHDNFFYKIGNVLFSVYGFSSIFIPVFLVTAGITSFATKWTARKTMRLLTALLPFFTCVITESLCRSLIKGGSKDFLGVKLAVIIITGLMLLVIEYLGAGILADKINNKTRKNKVTTGYTKINKFKVDGLEDAGNSVEPLHIIDTDTEKEEVKEEDDDEEEEEKIDIVTNDEPIIEEEKIDPVKKAIFEKVFPLANESIVNSIDELGVEEEETRLEEVSDESDDIKEEKIEEIEAEDELPVLSESEEADKTIIEEISELDDLDDDDENEEVTSYAELEELTKVDADVATQKLDKELEELIAEEENLKKEIENPTPVVSEERKEEKDESDDFPLNSTSVITQEEFEALTEATPIKENEEVEELEWNNLPPAVDHLPPEYDADFDEDDPSLEFPPKENEVKEETTEETYEIKEEIAPTPDFLDIDETMEEENEVEGELTLDSLVESDFDDSLDNMDFNTEEEDSPLDLSFIMDDDEEDEEEEEPILSYETKPVEEEIHPKKEYDDSIHENPKFAHGIVIRDKNYISEEKKDKEEETIVEPPKSKYPRTISLSENVNVIEDEEDEDFEEDVTLPFPEMDIAEPTILRKEEEERPNFTQTVREAVPVRETSEKIDIREERVNKEEEHQAEEMNNFADMLEKEDVTEELHVHVQNPKENKIFRSGASVFSDMEEDIRKAKGFDEEDFLEDDIDDKDIIEDIEEEVPSGEQIVKDEDFEEDFEDEDTHPVVVKTVEKSVASSPSKAVNQIDKAFSSSFGDKEISANNLTADELSDFFDAQQEENTPKTEIIEGREKQIGNRAVKKGPYVISSDLLTAYKDDQYWIIDEGTKKAALNLKQTLAEFNIEASITGIKKGPVVTMFEILPAPGVRLNKIVALQDNIALSLAAQSVRIVAPIPGKQAVGIEVPNKNRSVVGFREIIEMDLPEWKKMSVPVILGKDILGKAQLIDLVKTPHMLIAGATGSGKSVCVNSLILSILYKRSYKDVKLILIDPKVVELKLYNDIPHLLTPVITEPKKALRALQYCLCEMERRYALLDSMGVRDIANYNQKIKEQNICTEKLPYIVVIIDEFADLMATSGKELENIVARLTAMSRAVGIHLVLATQRPSVNVITGLIKANIPTRIAFMVASRTDSNIIIDTVGAEKLLGRGDMLYASAVDPAPIRIQGTFVNDQEVENVVTAVKEYGEPDYLDDALFNDDEEDKATDLFGEPMSDDDPLYDQALEIVVQAGKASASFIQRRLKIGYNRAARLVEEMEERGIVGPANGSKPREIIHIP